MTESEPKRPEFDRIARAYRWMEYFSLGDRLERVRLHYLPRLQTGRESAGRALILGDGDGRFAARLLARNPQLHADAVDLSSAMLALLERRCLRAGIGVRQRLQVHPQDALEFTRDTPPGTGYDLVVTHFFLDCLAQNDVEQLVRQVVPALRPGALWVLSEFRIPQGVLHWPAKLYVRMLYFAFRLLTGLRTTRLPNYAAAMREAGLVNVERRTFLFGLLTAELWQLPPVSPMNSFTSKRVEP